MNTFRLLPFYILIILKANKSVQFTVLRIYYIFMQIIGFTLYVYTTFSENTGITFYF